MTKSRFNTILLVALGVLVLIGVVLLVYGFLTVDDRRVINVDLDDGSSVIEFDELSMLPGEECGYTIALSGTSGMKYGVELDFTETEVETLKNYAFARIDFNGKAVCDELLATLLENDKISLLADFSDSEENCISIVYYLPEEIGNEAQNAEAGFELLITASNK